MDCGLYSDKVRVFFKILCERPWMAGLILTMFGVFLKDSRGYLDCRLDFDKIWVFLKNLCEAFGLLVRFRQSLACFLKNC